MAALAALLLVGVLSLLIIESRAVKEDYYVAHAERLRAVETSGNDIEAIGQGARGAFDEGRATPSSIPLAFASLKANAERLGVPSKPAAPDSIVPAQFAAYDAELTRFLSAGEAFAARQNTLAEALRRLQEESPTVVKDLRRFNLRIQSQNAFSLAIDLMEFAMGRGQFTSEQLAERIAALRADPTVDREVPGRLDSFAAAASTILSQHVAAETALADITNSNVDQQLAALGAAIAADNRVIVSRAERARVLLAVCAVLLLLGAGFAMYRLQNSYRDLNKSNAKLARLNDSLEQRVAERTEELSAAYHELKESQVQLVQAEKMSSLGELVAGISHEINTPLWYLMSNSAVIQERLADIGEFLAVAEKMVVAARTRTGVKEAISAGLADMNRMLAAGMKDDMDEARDLVQDSMDGLEELTELAQSLKDFSRLDRAKQGEFNVNEGLDKTLLIIKNKIKHKVTVHKHYGEVPNIVCSPSQINQIFLNLIVNAADAIAKEGDVVLQTWAKDGKVGIRVSDTGCGIPAEQLAKVRDPFFTTKEVGKGTGLGLSIVDQIIKAHHGELKIESEPGKGTTITVVLPVKPPPEAPATEAPAEAGKTQAAAVKAPAKAPAATAMPAAPPVEPAVADEEGDWAGDTNVNPATAARVEEAEDWAGDTNVVAEDEAPAPAADESEDWAGDTNVAAGKLDLDDTEDASNDAPDTVDPADTAVDEEGDWAGDTNVSDARVVAADAQNDAEAFSADDTLDTLAETDVRSIDHEALQAEAERAAASRQNGAASLDASATVPAMNASIDDDDYYDEDEVDQFAETTVTSLDIVGGVHDPDEATVVADWNIENEVIELFGKGGAGEKTADDADAAGPAKKPAATDEPPARTDG